MDELGPFLPRTAFIDASHSRLFDSTLLTMNDWVGFSASTTGFS
jgi:hypothetical protein